MIKITTHQSDRPSEPGLEMERTIVDTLRYIVELELAFGEVTDLGPTYLVIRNRTYGSFDTARFEGSEVEMRPVLATAAMIFHVFGARKISPELAARASMICAGMRPEPDMLLAVQKEPLHTQPLLLALAGTKQELALVRGLPMSQLYALLAATAERLTGEPRNLIDVFA